MYVVLMLLFSLANEFTEIECSHSTCFLVQIKDTREECYISIVIVQS